MSSLQFDGSKAEMFLEKSALAEAAERAEAAKTLLLSREGAGNDFLGWVDLPENYDKEEFARIKKAAEKINNNAMIFFITILLS